MCENEQCSNRIVSYYLLKKLIKLNPVNVDSLEPVQTIYENCFQF